MRTKAFLIITLIFIVLPFSNAQKSPKIDETVRIKKLEPPKGIVRIVLDTDTYNEMDDQFALCFAYL